MISDAARLKRRASTWLDFFPPLGNRRFYGKGAPNRVPFFVLAGPGFSYKFLTLKVEERPVVFEKRLGELTGIVARDFIIESRY